MPEFSLSLKDGNPDELARMNKTLNWLMNNLDHLNVKRLYTEYCDIQSEAGETIIDGPLIKMTAGTTTLRLKMGKEGSDFTFALYNSLGVQTVGIDSSGNGSFTGSITGSVITGGTIQTSISGARIVMNSSGLAFYDSSGVVRAGFGLSASTGGVNYYPLKFYSETGANVGTITGLTSELHINSTATVGIGGTILNLYGASAINILGTLNADRIQGFTNSYISYLGTGNCNINTNGGDMRLGNSGGAYLIITNSGLTYYDSVGTPHIIV